MMSFVFLALGFSIFYMADSVLERQREKQDIRFEAELHKNRHKYAEGEW